MSAISHKLHVLHQILNGEEEEEEEEKVYAFMIVCEHKSHSDPNQVSRSTNMVQHGHRSVHCTLLKCSTMKYKGGVGW